MKVPSCPYCGNPAKLVKNSSPVYHGRDYGPVWICWNCQAWVGCHENSDFIPLGRLANAELRRAKIEAHAAFDPLWKAVMRRDRCSKKNARGRAYQWLAKELGIRAEDCHIGMMDVAECKRVAEACRAIRRKHGQDAGVDTGGGQEREPQTGSVGADR